MPHKPSVFTEVLLDAKAALDARVRFIRTHVGKRLCRLKVSPLSFR
jgi:enoyl-[acyl-carrier-protein] reductase (NADH)